MNITGDTAALTEIQVAWGEDTRCSTCLCDLPAGATAIPDGGRLMCTDCAQDGGEFSYEDWIGQRVRAASALRKAERAAVAAMEAVCRDTTHVLTGKA